MISHAIRFALVLALLSATRLWAAPVFHYDWVGKSSIEPAVWDVHQAGPSDTFEIIEPGRLRVTSSSNWSTFLSSVDKVAVPNASTKALEVIVDVWNGEIFNAAGCFYGNPAAFSPASDPYMAFASFFVGYGRAGQNKCIAWFNGSSQANLSDDTPPYPFRTRLSWSGAPGSGINFQWRRLDVYGQFIGDWSTPGLIAQDLLTTGLPGPTSTDAPWHFAYLPYNGVNDFGMVEIYDTTGNDGMIPAPGAAVPTPTPPPGPATPVFHYDWVNKTNVDPAVWNVFLADDFLDSVEIVPPGRLRVTSVNGWLTHIDTVHPVAVPSSSTQALEIIVDFWGAELFNAAGCFYGDSSTFVPASDPHMALATFAVGYGRASQDKCIAWFNGSSQTGLSENTPPYPFRTRLSWSGSVGSGINFQWRRLNPDTGQFIGDWSTPGHIAQDLITSGTTGGTATDAPWHFTFMPYNGEQEFGMVEIYDTTGNDGTIPAPGSNNIIIPAASRREWNIYE